MEEKTYTKQEVKELIEPLMKQIEFFSGENIKLKRYILNEWIPFGKKGKFLEEIIAEEDNSNTLIFNIIKAYNAK